MRILLFELTLAVRDCWCWRWLLSNHINHSSTTIYVKLLGWKFNWKSLFRADDGLNSKHATLRRDSQLFRSAVHTGELSSASSL